MLHGLRPQFLRLGLRLSSLTTPTNVIEYLRYISYTASLSHMRIGIPSIRICRLELTGLLVFRFQHWNAGILPGSVLGDTALYSCVKASAMGELGSTTFTYIVFNLLYSSPVLLDDSVVAAQHH